MYFCGCQSEFFNMYIFTLAYVYTFHLNDENFPLNPYTWNKMQS